MARVLIAVSRRVPSSASRAVSPSGWMRTRTVERCGGMCAHKNGVEDAGDDSHTQKARACEPDRPARDDGGRRQVPRGEIATDATNRGGEVEKVGWLSGGGKRRRGVRKDEQCDQPPRKRKREKRDHMRVDASHRRVAHRRGAGVEERGRQRVPR